jgi:hypothetical protein
MTSPIVAFEYTLAYNVSRVMFLTSDRFLNYSLLSCPPGLYTNSSIGNEKPVASDHLIIGQMIQTDLLGSR